MELFVVGKIGFLCQKLKKLKTHLFFKQIRRRVPIKPCSFSAPYKILQVEFWLSSKFSLLPAFVEAKFAFVYQWSVNPKIQNSVFPKLVCSERISSDRVSFSFFQNVSGYSNFRLRLQVLVFVIFTRRRFQSVFQNTQKSWTSNSKFSCQKFIRWRNLTYIFFWNALSKNLVS